MQNLSLRQAGRCENAKHSRCRCRCGGALHGKSRGADPQFFHALDPSDAHAVPYKPPRKGRRRKQRDLFDD